MRRRALKPTQKQKAVIHLLDVIEEEGSLESAVCFCGAEKIAKKTEDDELMQLIEEYDKSFERLNDKINKLIEEVAPFRDGDDDHWSR
jgi:hypothetical protein